MPQQTITPQLLQNLNVTYSSIFNDAYADLANAAPIYWQGLAEEIPSGTIEDVFGYMKGISGYRQWIGDREIETLDASGYTITSSKFEKTIGVKRDDIIYDKLGLYNARFRWMGTQARMFRDQLLWPLIAGGATGVGPDGQYFYDTDHPLTDRNGNPVTYSNYVSGDGPLWLLVARPGGIKPFILTRQEELDFVPMVEPDNPHVFFKDEYVWGSKGRFGCGYFLWQLVQAMMTPLAEPYFSEAWAALATRMGDKGSPMPMIPTDIYVPQSLRASAAGTLLVERLADGASNYNFKVVNVNFVPYLDYVNAGQVGIGT